MGENKKTRIMVLPSNTQLNNNVFKISLLVVPYEIILIG
jgi:hypothetical protein